MASQADRAGLSLKRRLLEHVAAADPEPDLLEAALIEFIEALGLFKKLGFHEIEKYADIPYAELFMEKIL